MKTLLLPTLLAAVLFTGCTKEDAPSLVGVWRPVSVVAYIEGTTDSTRHQPGTHTRLAFLRGACKYPLFWADTLRMEIPYSQAGATLTFQYSTPVTGTVPPGTVLELTESRLRVKVPDFFAAHGEPRYTLITATR